MLLGCFAGVIRKLPREAPDRSCPCRRIYVFVRRVFVFVFAVCVCFCYIYIYIYIYIYTHTHTYMYTYMCASTLLIEAARVDDVELHFAGGVAVETHL